ncbi:MAG: DUF4124 domain-containing protein, partial [Burkholderiales bacterium]
MRAIVLLLIAVASLGALAQQTYRWVDSEGKVHYSDRPPPPSVKKIEKKDLSAKPGGEQPLPYLLKQATEKFPVTLYTSECGIACKRAQQFLAKRGVPHTELDATQPQIQEELKKHTGGTLEVPVLLVGQMVLRGYEDGRWNAALDAAGYPRTALIHVTPTRPKPPQPEAAQT